jgi:hypothetical protein
MIKRFCDACGREIPEGTMGQTFSYLCHIDDVLDGKDCYIDHDGNSISCRAETKELCIYCYNRAMIEAVKKFRELKEIMSINYKSWYPIGTKAYTSGGGYWEKTERGWKWCTGATFPTPGGDCIGIVEPEEKGGHNESYR